MQTINVRERMDQAGLTVDELARLAGVPRWSVCCMAGTQQGSLCLEAAAVTLRCSCDELIARGMAYWMARRGYSVDMVVKYSRGGLSRSTVKRLLTPETPDLRQCWSVARVLEPEITYAQHVTSVPLAGVLEVR